MASIGSIRRDALGKVLGDIGASLHVDREHVQQTLSVYLFTFAFMMLFYGTLSDTFGRRRVILWAVGVLQIWHLLVLEFVIGIFTVFFDVAYQSYLPSLVDRHRSPDLDRRLARPIAAGAGKDVRRCPHRPRGSPRHHRLLVRRWHLDEQRRWHPSAAPER